MPEYGSEAHERPPASTRSEMSGQAENVVQSGAIEGGVHFHHADTVSLPVPHQLPPSIWDFSGRRFDVAALDALLPGAGARDTSAVGSPGTVVISAIHGTAGVGKTALAVHWAHRVRDRFPDGTLYSNLRGYGPGQPATPSEVLGGFLHALGIPSARVPVELGEMEALYRSLLDSRRVLVVLDNANASEQVRPLLPAGAGCLALVTSRSSMTGLVISHGAARVNLDVLPLDDATALLGGIVGSARATAEPEALVQIADACVRLPLALRITGQRVAANKHLRLVEVMAELADEAERLDALSSTGDESTAVRAVFAWSYQALSPDRAVVFRRLGLHPGAEISISAVAALAALSPTRARRALEALAEVHLVEPVGQGRYAMHDLLRAYALECAERDEQPPERAAATERMLGFYLYAADAADRKLMMRGRMDRYATSRPRYPATFDTEEQARDWFQLETANLLASTRYAAKNRLYALAWQIPVACNGIFGSRGVRIYWLSTLREGLAAARAIGDSIGEHSMLVCLSEALLYVGQFDEGMDHARQSLLIAQRESDRTLEAESLLLLGYAYSEARQFDAAIDCLEQSLETRMASGDAWSTAIVLNHLGAAYRRAEKFDRALECHQNALEVFQQADDKGRESWTLQLTGDLHQVAGHLDDATTYHRQAVDAARAASSTHFEAAALNGLGMDAHQSGDDNSARRYWTQALALFEQLGDPQSNDLRAWLGNP